MALEKYIGPGETIKMKFRMSFRYFLSEIILILLCFGGLMYVFKDNPFFLWLLGGTGGILLFYQAHVYFTTWYFSTEKKVYKKVGFIWSKVTSSKATEIENIEINQGVLQRIFFNMGTLKFNTAASLNYEIVMKRVGDPYTKKKLIEAGWIL